MSSANPKVSEPSMEEILASIRRIISDDQGTFTGPRSAAPGLYAVPHHSESEAREADDAEAEPGPRETAELADTPDDTGSSAVADPVALEAAAAVSPDNSPLPDMSSGLLSGAVSASIASAFGRLEPRPQAAGAASLEDTVKDMLRPMLKAWLDQNLPAIVERLVQAEIERVTRS